MGETLPTRWASGAREISSSDNYIQYVPHSVAKGRDRGSGKIDMRLKGKTAIITGGANGIGAGCVRRLASEGANVVIADIDDASGKALADEIGKSALYVHTNVTQRASVEALCAATLTAFGAVDILVNNAAFVHKDGVIANFLDYSDESWELTLAVNLSGMFYCSQTAARLMAKRGVGGVIISMSSGGGSRAHRHMFGYDTSKGGIEAATRVMALDLAPLNIRVNSRHPGQHARRSAAPSLAIHRSRHPRSSRWSVRAGRTISLPRSLSWLPMTPLISPAHASSSTAAWMPSCARHRSIFGMISATTVRRHAITHKFRQRGEIVKNIKAPRGEIEG